MSYTVDYDFIYLLLTIQTNLYRFGGPILIVLGTISNVCSLLVFSRKNLRKNPCAIYFLAFNISNLILIYASFLPPTLSIGYNIDSTTMNIDLCRLRLYVAFVLNCLCRTFLILASFDRALITSPNANIRERSTCRNACILIISLTSFWMILLIHLPIFTVILELAPGIFVCYIQPGTYTTVITYTSLVKEVTAPLYILLCGLWSIKNIHRIHTIVPHSLNRATQSNQTRIETHSNHAKDRQLLLMLIADIFIYIPFSLVMTCALLYTYFTLDKPQTLEQIQTGIFFSNIAMYTAHIPFCITSYVHLFISKTFKKELLNILSCK